MENESMKPGESLYSANTNDRISYDPAWTKERPYCTFRKGAAGAQFASLESAKRHLGGGRWLTASEKIGKFS